MNLIEKIYEADNNDSPRKRVNIIFDEIDALLCSNKFGPVDHLLQTVDLDKLTTDSLIGILTITADASDKLPHRSFFFNRVKNILKIREEDVEKILLGLDRRN